MVKKQLKHVTPKDAKWIIALMITGALLGLVLCYALIPETYNNRIRENKSIVINQIGASKELVNFLKDSDQNCNDVKNVFVIRRVINDQFAYMTYGCEADSSMYAYKKDGAWQLISPTNNFVNGVPGCAMVDQYKIPKKMTALCYEPDATTPGSTKLRNNTN